MSTSPYVQSLVSALASGAIGAGAARTMTHRKEDESDEQYKRRLSLNTSTGALGGGAVGAGLPLLYSFVKSLEKKEFIDRLFDHPVDTVVGEGSSKVIETAGLGGLGGAAAGAITSKTTGFAANSSAAKAVKETFTNRAGAEASQAHAGGQRTKAQVAANLVTPEMDQAQKLFEKSVRAQQEAISHANSVKTKLRYRGPFGALVGGIVGAVGENYLDKAL